ncbi:MAG: ATP-binding cassette domain-containing protein, partial [Candidatus Methanomethyliaceae archaeon]|nr:ATP-binding cassette domain-containing protein [Candidatus Methanomethyliaceae archaeon]
MISIEVRELSKEYSGLLVLDKVSFKIGKSEFFAIVGPSGAGKTTLLRIIGLIDFPKSGLVMFNGEIIDYGKDNLNLRRKIGLVFQQPVLFNMSVFDNIAYPLRIRGYDRNYIRNKVEEVMRLLKIENLEGKNALDLSGG